MPVMEPVPVHLEELGALLAHLLEDHLGVLPELFLEVRHHAVKVARERVELLVGETGEELLDRKSVV